MIKKKSTRYVSFLSICLLLALFLVACQLSEAPAASTETAPVREEPVTGPAKPPMDEGEPGGSADEAAAKPEGPEESVEDGEPDGPEVLALDLDMTGGQLLRPGEGREITALVELAGSGTANISWEASAGNISGEGLTVTYTAPPLAGGYTITALANRGEVRATLDVEVAAGERFSIVVIPDTQNMIRQSGNTMVDQMFSWVAASAANLDTVFVTHVGDVVSNASRSAEWQRAVDAFSHLAGRLPYSVTFGNHEYETHSDMDSSIEGYLANFGPARYESYPWYGGSDATGKNHYQIFEAGGREFLHLALEWEVPGDVSDPATAMGWARQVLEAHEGLPTIITTHAYLWDKPGYEGHSLEVYGPSYTGRETGSNTGQEIFRSLVEPYPQVFMVLGGHFHRGSLAKGTLGEYHQVSRNSAGQPVFEMLSNYQSHPGSGNGWLRIIEFAEGGGEDGLDRISVYTYSPVLDEYQVDWNSHFHFDLDFEERWSGAYVRSR